MASSNQLVLGFTGKLSTIKTLWMKHNKHTGYDTKVAQNIRSPKARHFSVCCSALTTGWKLASCCGAHVEAIGDTQEVMSIVSLELSHSCDGAEKRKRGHFT